MSRRLKLAESTLLVELRRIRTFQPLRIPGDRVRPVLQFDFRIFGALGRPVGHIFQSVIVMGNLRLQLFGEIDGRRFETLKGNIHVKPPRDQIIAKLDQRDVMQPKLACIDL